MSAFDWTFSKFQLRLHAVRAEVSELREQLRKAEMQNNRRFPNSETDRNSVSACFCTVTETPEVSEVFLFRQICFCFVDLVTPLRG